MRHLSLAVLALALVSAPTVAQTTPITPPKVAPCDSSAVLLGATPIFNVGTKTIVAACPTFADRIATFFAGHPALTASELVSELLHGTLQKPPSDTVISPPAVTPPPVIVPKDSTPRDTAVVTPPAGALLNAHPMGPLTAPFVVVPQGWAGRSGPDIKTGGGCAGSTACHTGEGANRFLCAYAKMAFDDPIVFPGQPGASHLHQFFGNAGVTAFTDSASIASTGNSTCSGGIANRTGYWTPAVVDASGNIVTPSTATIYYKSGYQMQPSLVQPTPTGLRMIAGDKNWSDTKQNQARVWWTCDGGPGPQYSSTIPDCGARVMLIVIFPQCWDGVHLDSPDHKSHMAYPAYSNPTDGSKCPNGWVVVPEITEEFFWPVPAGVKSSTWHISSDMDLTKPGGLSAHADWMMGWDPNVMKTFVSLCLDMSKDCQVNGIGNNTYLNPPP